MSKRFLLLIVCCLGLAAVHARPADAQEEDAQEQAEEQTQKEAPEQAEPSKQAEEQAQEPELGIGSQAPSLDIEHWIQDGEGAFEPVKELEPGKVYVIEFWATWCGPCIASMPHLAELQTKYRGRDVRIVSISDESLETVQEFLERESPNSEKTFDEITSAYSLTADPDGSAHEDYMAAANLNGIPAAFLVGKTGKVEWIGHPMEIDEPLEAVVDGSWDRAAFKKEYEAKQRLEKLMQQIMRLAGTGKAEEAIKLIETELESTENEAIAQQLNAIRYELKLDAGQLDEETLAFFREQINSAKDDPMSLARFAFALVGKMQAGTEVGPLDEEVAAAIESEVESASEELRPMLYTLLARLYVGSEQLEKAIRAQEKAVEAAEGKQKERLQKTLDQLKEEVAGEDGDQPAEAEEASAE